MQSVVSTDDSDDLEKSQTYDGRADGREVVPSVKENAANRVDLHIVGGPEQSSAVSDATRTQTERRLEFLLSRQSAVLRLVAEFIDQPSLAAGLTALVEELFHRFRCNRVVVGLWENNRVSVAGISQQANVNSNSGEITLLGDAMQEACEQDTLISYPAADNSLTIVEAHRALLTGVANTHIYTIPLYHQDRMVGALLFETDAEQSWSPLTIDLVNNMADTIAPLIAIRIDSEISLSQALRRKVERTFTGILKPQHLMLKLTGIALALFVFCANFISVSHRLTATGELVSTERRVIASPILGYIDSVHVDVGDTVTAGQKLVDLDVRDLQVQSEKLDSEINSAESEFRSAMAAHDRKEMAVAQAQLNRARAERKLILNQINRAQLVAPVDGIIVSGDLNQMIGAPVERGATLLEMAPQFDYEIKLLVDESDVGYAKAGQTGRLSLKSNPGDSLEFKVVAINPIAVAENGAAKFQLDAALLELPAGLRPGQTGIARLSVGQASLLWVWTHEFFEWSQQRIWEWLG